MTTIYNVDVERAGFGFCTSIRTAASSPMLACEAAERIAAANLYGADWSKVVHQFFAYHVREMTAGEFIPGYSDEPNLKATPDGRYDY